MSNISFDCLIYCSQERNKLKLSNENSAYVALDAFEKTKRSLQRERQRCFPVAAHERIDIQIPTDWKLTLNKTEEFLLCDTETKDRILVICRFILLQH